MYAFRGYTKRQLSEAAFLRLSLIPTNLYLLEVMALIYGTQQSNQVKCFSQLMLPSRFHASSVMAHFNRRAMLALFFSPFSTISNNAQ